MKEKWMNNLRRLAQAVLVPGYILPMVGLLIAIGNLLAKIGSADLFPFIDPSTMIRFGHLLTHTLVAFLKHLGLVFGVGAAIGLANKKQTEAGFAALLAYIIYIQALPIFLGLNEGLIASELLRGSGQTMRAGVHIPDRGIILGILIGGLTALIHNHLVDIEFDNVLQIYGGKRLVLLFLIPLVILLAMVMSFVWPLVQSGIRALASLINQSGNLGLLVYGMTERLLIPTGLQSLIYVPFLYTSLGGVQEVGGQIFEGARTIYLAEMTDPNVRVLSETVIWDARGISKMFGLMGACLAMYHTAKPENKEKVKAILIPAAFTSFVTGVTEPIEFSFMFVAPVLFVLHAVLSGCSLVVLNLLDVRAIGPNGFIDFLIYNVPLGFTKTKWPLYLLVGLVFFLIYYFLFRLVITRLDLKTIGREPDSLKTQIYSKEDYERKQQNKRKVPKALKVPAGKEEFGVIPILVTALGGSKNIETIDSCYSRLRLTVRDPGEVDEEMLKKKTGASGVVRSGRNIQIVYGLQINSIRRLLVQYLEKIAEK